MGRACHNMIHLETWGASMTTSFDDRERAYEAKFAHDAELNFKAESRRNRLLGEWAAGLLGKSGDDVAAYAKEVVAADFEEAGDEDVFRKLAGDLAGKADEATIRAKMTELRDQARRQVAEDA